MFPLVFSLFFGCIFAVALDSHRRDIHIKRIAFGSCSNHRFPFEYIDSIIKIEPDVLLWTGDIVYGRTKHGKIMTTIRQNYQSLKAHPSYQRLLASDVIIEGVYDDHDIGMNDADTRLAPSIQKEAQQLLLDFLDVDSGSDRRQRNGAYAAHKFDDILVIMLDTRTHRSPTVIPSLGKWEVPFTAWIASYVRYLTTYFGFVPDESITSVLGDEQWHWLEQILQSHDFETSKLVLVVSSTQIFTSNPYFESWGHFPAERMKLVGMLQAAISPEQHLLFISGDVHHAEFLYGNENYGPLEVTSSGLTHALGTMRSFIARKLSTRITDTYGPQHRTKYANASVQTVYYERNFGVIEVENDMYTLKIYDAVSAELITEVSLNKERKSSPEQVLNEMSSKTDIGFPVNYPFCGLEIFGPLLAILLFIATLAKFICSRCTGLDPPLKID